MIQAQNPKLHPSYRLNPTVSILLSFFFLALLVTRMHGIGSRYSSHPWAAPGSLTDGPPSSQSMSPTTVVGLLGFTLAGLLL